MRKTILSFGEVLWDLLPAPRQPALGGAPGNFAFRANSLGDRGLAVTRLGRDELGDRALARLQHLGMETDLIQRDDLHRTGTVDVTLDENKNPFYVINTDVAYDHIELHFSLATAVQEADCLCYGTLAQRGPTTRATLEQLLETAPKPIKLLDINLRKDCYSRSIIKSSLEKANILKLNREELAELADMFELLGDSIANWIDQLIEKWSLSHCLVTLDQLGAFVASDDGTQIYVPGYEVEVQDPCGSGDAFSAGFVHLLLRDSPLQSCAVLGNVLGAMVAEQSGCTTPISQEEIDRFLEQDRRRKYEPSLESFCCGL